MKTRIWLLHDNLQNTRDVIAELDGFVGFCGNSTFTDSNGKTWKVENGGSFDQKSNTMNYYIFEIIL